MANVALGFLVCRARPFNVEWYDYIQVKSLTLAVVWPGIPIFPYFRKWNLEVFFNRLSFEFSVDMYVMHGEF